MNFGRSISVFFSALCVLASIIFSVACIYLLFGEQKEVDISLGTAIDFKVYDPSKYTSARRINFDLSDEKGVRLFQQKLEDYSYEYEDYRLEKLLCVPLNVIEIFRNQSELLLERMGDDLVEHLNATFYRSLLKEHTDASEIRQNLKVFELTVLRFFQSRSFYILRDRLCLKLKYLWFTELYIERLFGRHVSSHMFIRTSDYLVRLKRSSDAFDFRLILNHFNPNMEKGCEEDETGFPCLNDCLKERHRLSKYFYDGNETGAIQPPWTSLASSNASTKKLIAQQEAECFEKCKELLLCHVTEIRIKNVEDKDVTDNLNSSTHLISPGSNRIKLDFYLFEPLMSNFSFWIQLCGLTLSFFGVSCYNLSMRAGNQLPLNKKSVNLLFKVLLWSVCVTVFLYLSKESLENYSNKRSYQAYDKTSVSYSDQPEQTAVVVCIPVDAFLENDSKNMTLAELELATNDLFNRTVDSLSLEFFNNPFPTDYEVSDAVLFTANYFTSELGRCFQIDLDDLKVEREYHSIYSDMNLVITFKQPNYELYLLPEGQRFNYHSYGVRFDHSPKLNKVIFKSSPLQCENYYKKYGASCNSRWNCLDECIVNRSIENDLDIPILHVIDKKLFNTKEWSDGRPNYNLKGNPRIEDELRFVFKQIGCREEIAKPDCYKVFFERDPTSGSNLGADWQKIKIELYNKILFKASREEAGYDVILDLLNVLTLMFDFQALPLLTACVLFFKIKVFEWEFVTRKLFVYPVFAFCLAGLTLHVLFIFGQVQNSQLIFSSHYEELDSQRMPELNFCFDHEKWLEATRLLNATGEFGEEQISLFNGKLTGRILEMATMQYRADTVFSSISYFGKNGWIGLNLTGMPTDKPRFKWHGVTFERFYFMDQKCLSISTDQIYYRKNFYFADTYDGTYDVIRVNFNRSFIEQDLLYKPIVFYTRTDKRFLSQVNYLNYTSPLAKSEKSKISFTLRQEQLEIINNDKFKMAKNPLLYRTDRFNNFGKYMGTLMREFRKEHNSTTLNLPITEDYFDLPIQDNKFSGWAEERQLEKPPNIQNQAEGALVYERKVIENRIEKHFYGLEKPDFKFHIKFGKFKQVFRAKENIAKFILNLMNSLSLWLSISFFQTFVLKSGLFAGKKSAVRGEPETQNDAKTTQTYQQPESNFAVIESNFDTKYNSL